MAGCAAADGEQDRVTGFNYRVNLSHNWAEAIDLHSSEH